MAELGASNKAVTRAEQKAERRRRVMDILEPRLMTILLILPPTLGAILGGVAVTAYRRLTGQLKAQISQDYVTLGLGIFCTCGLGVILFLSARVYRGATTRFPRLLRIAPFGVAAGLIFGTVVASLKAAGRIT
jgi:hypothetical protein